MKKRLLKPPQNNGEIIFLSRPFYSQRDPARQKGRGLPGLEEFSDKINEEGIIGTAHQPYFFHPGISLKFIFLESLSKANKQAVFLDNDRVKIAIKIPTSDSFKIISLIDTDSILYDCPTPKEERFNRFFNEVEVSLKKSIFDQSSRILANFLKFKDIFFKNSQHKLFKEVLVRSFLQFYGIGEDFCFSSDLIGSQEFQEFFLKVCQESRKFQQIFNAVLDEYSKVFRFRYKNYPFPRLQDDELPFWIIKGGKRIRCFKKDLGSVNIARVKIFPRAVTLTIFLRLYKINFFIHGIGGANYEWVQDRIIERFFRQTPPCYAVISGTFLIADFDQRDFPYFFFSAEQVKERVYSFIKKPCFRNCKLVRFLDSPINPYATKKIRFAHNTD